MATLEAGPGCDRWIMLGPAMDQVRCEEQHTADDWRVEIKHHAVLTAKDDGRYLGQVWWTQ